jgi:hypothetical protein
MNLFRRWIWTNKFNWKIIKEILINQKKINKIINKIRNNSKFNRAIKKFHQNY